MSEITEAYSYGVAMKPEGKIKLYRFLLICLYVLIPVVAIGLMMFSQNGGLYAIFGCLLCLADVILVFFTWRYVSFDYEYEIASGKLSFKKVLNAFNHRIPKPQMEFLIKECSAIEPYNNPEFPDSMKKYEDYKADKVYMGLAHSKAPDAYYALFTDAEGQKCAFLFQMTGDTLKRCVWYNKEATVKSQTKI